MNFITNEYVNKIFFDDRRGNEYIRSVFHLEKKHIETERKKKEDFIFSELQTILYGEENNISEGGENKRIIVNLDKEVLRIVYGKKEEYSEDEKTKVHKFLFFVFWESVILAEISSEERCNGIGHVSTSWLNKGVEKKWGEFAEGKTKTLYLKFLSWLRECNYDDECYYPGMKFYLEDIERRDEENVKIKEMKFKRIENEKKKGIKHICKQLSEEGTYCTCDCCVSLCPIHAYY